MAHLDALRAGGAHCRSALGTATARDSAGQCNANTEVLAGHAMDFLIPLPIG
jgi:hypothetical protein